ncbi:uncharacterized protein [Leptinotarsa decemlineata]|uniref:uncharacterized protein n=1 Tax=Leptinotarsa decemlineata TaxID=7539 RepID=UPI003D309902
MIQTERGLPHTVLNNEEVANKTIGQERIQQFKPSPHLGTYYEHNPFPVTPAHAEAKSHGSYFPRVWEENPRTSLNNNPVVWTETPSVPTWMEKQNIQNPWEQNVWTENPQQNVLPGKTTIDTGKVKFPITGHDRPYQFVTVVENVPLLDYSVTTESLPIINHRKIKFKNPLEPTSSFWGKLLGYGNAKDKVPEPLQKTFYDYNSLEKPLQLNTYEIPKEHTYNVDQYEPYGRYAVNPWKKVIKFLATIIPIGLFISALTPTVITVSSANDTQSRYRNDDSKEQNVAKRLTSSLTYFDKLNQDGCEDKVLCELLVSALFSKNAERHIRNLLDNFIQQEDLQNKKDDLLKIFEAVKNQDCSPILCGNIKNPT